MNRPNLESRPLTVEIVGGLGNQMFAAAAGLMATQETHRGLIFDVSFFKRVGANRTYQLDKFPAFRGTPTTETAFSGHRRYIDGACRRLHIPQIGLYREHGFGPSIPGFDQNWPPTMRVTRLKGYFQSWRYFEGKFEEVRAAFRPDLMPSLLAQIHTAVGSRFISIHMRRGDYMTVDARAQFGLPSERYLLNGLAILRDALGPQTPIVLFSDSPEHVPSAIRKQVEYTVGPEPGRSPVEDLHALAAGSGLLMSNSSYSWWAAFLSDHQNRPVVAPRPWFRGHRVSLNDLLLPHWIALDARYSD